MIALGTHGPGIEATTAMWMAALTMLIGIETLAPHGKRIGRLVGAGMVLWGLTPLTGF